MGLKKNHSWEDRRVVAGIGIDSVRIDMSRSELLALLGKPNEENVYKSSCNGVESHSDMHWFPPSNPDGSVNGDGIFAFVINGVVFEIRFGQGYYTDQGTKYGSKLTDLKTKIAAPLFRLDHSANTSTNDADLFFVIEKDNGISYEIGEGWKTKERLVNAIYVFRPNSDFLPWGCLSENQTLAPIPYP